MSENDGIYKSVENACQIIRSVKCSKEDKIDAYFTLYRYFQTHQQECIAVIGKSTNSLFVLIQKHIRSEEKGLVESTLTFLGHALSVEAIINEIQESILKNLCEVLCSILKESTEKSVVIRVLWCFSHQVFPEVLIKQYVKPLIDTFGKLHADVNTKSDTLNNESLRMIKRLSEQCPEELKVYIDEWMPHVFKLLITDVVKNREVALEVVETGMPILMEKQSYMCTFLLNQLNNQDLCAKLNALFHNDIAPVHVLNTWACILRLLGESFFDLNRVKVTNPLLKIAEKSFGSKTAEVTLALNNLWRALIDAVFTRPGEFGKRMEKIFLLPIRIRYKNEVIAQENLKTQWHLLCMIGPKINEYVDKAFNPLLDVYLKPSVTNATNTSLEVSNKSLSTPVRSAQQKNDVSASTPKSPYNVSSKTKLLAAEMLLQLFTEKKDRQQSRALKLELFTAPCLSKENLVTHCPRYTTYLLNLTEVCGAKHEAAVAHIWIAFLVRLREIAETEGNATAKDVWSPVLLALHEIVDKWMATCMLPLKILLLIPENVLKMSIPELSTLVTEKLKKNPDSLVTLFSLQLLLHKNSLQNEAFEQERFFILYERVIGTIFSMVTNQLQSAEIVFEYLKEANSDISMQHLRWRLWSTLTSLLMTCINKTNDVNQATSNAEYDFRAVLRSLTHPLRFIDLSKLREGTMKELFKVWEEMLEVFTRSVSLLSGVETNLALERVFFEIGEILTSSVTDVKMCHTVIQMTKFSSKFIDHSDTNKIFTSRLTPTKVTQKLKNPLGNLTSYVNVVKLSMNRCIELYPKETKAVDSDIIELLDIIDSFCANVESTNILTKSLYVFALPLSQMIDGNIKFSSKVTVKTEKVISQIFTILENNKSLLFDSELLQQLEPLVIKTLPSSRKLLRNRTAQFWNQTFGKSRELQYSTELKTLLTKYENKLNLILPGAQTKNQNEFTNALSESFMDDTAQFPDSSLTVITASPNLKLKSATSGSPIKIHGSFLQMGKKSPIDSGKLGSPKDVLGNFLASGCRTNSPKSPFKGSSKTVRRKLPVGLNPEDSCDYVEIKDSPASKKKRILTEHQKERIRERRELPVMYNDLDQSQDIVMRSLSQDLTQDSSQFRLPEQVVAVESATSGLNPPEQTPLHATAQLLSINEVEENQQRPIKNRFNDDVDREKLEDATVDGDAEKSLETSVTSTENNDHIVEESETEKQKDKDRSFEMVPSSQTQDELSNSKSCSKKKRESLLASQLLNVSQKLSPKCSTSEQPIVINSSNEDSLLSSGKTSSKGETDSTCDNSDSNNNNNVNQEKSEAVCETEEIELFEGSTPVTKEQSKGTETSSETEGVESQIEIQKNSAASISSKSTSQMDEEEPEKKTINMEAKIIVNKLPSARRKRKRSIPAKLPILEQQGKKRKLEAKENKPVGKRTPVNSRRKSIRNANKNDTERPYKADARNLNKSSSAIEKLDGTHETENDIFKFSDSDNKNTKPKRGRDRNNRSSLAIVNKKENTGDVLLEPKIEESETDTDTEKVINERPVPIITATEIQQDADDKSRASVVKERPVPVINYSDLEDVVEVIPESDVARDEKTDDNTLLDCVKTKTTDFERGASTPIDGTKNKDTTNAKSVPPTLQLQSGSSKEKLNSSTVSSPVHKTLVKNPFLNHSVNSPSRSSFVPSPIASPATSILKKRFNSDALESPSPQNKRRVSFQLPSGAIILPEDDLASPLPDDDQTADSKPFTVVRKKSKEKKKKKIAPKPAVFPDLVTCKAPIEKILPSLTFSRGVGHLVRAQNILTVGDLSALSENQIEALPIRSPKVSTVRNALRTFSSQISRDKPIPKSPLVIGQPHDDSFMDSDTPTKDETSLVEEAALLLTPSRHHDDVKPTSLFSSQESTVPPPPMKTDKVSADDLDTTPEHLLKSASQNTDSITAESSTATLEMSTIPELKIKTSNIGEPEVTGTCEASELLENKKITAEPDAKELVVVIAEKPESPLDKTAFKSKDNELILDINAGDVKICETASTRYENTATTTCHEQSERNIQHLLSELSTIFHHCSSLTNTELFNVISELDQMSKKAMETLRVRMSEKN